MANDIRRYDPFGEISRFEPFFGLDQMFRDFRLAPGLRDLPVEPQIKMDVTESDTAYSVKAEIPGVKKEDIAIDIDKNQVTIKAEVRKESEEKEGEKVVRSERYYGQQYRSFSLAQNVDQEKATAKYENGILQLDLPKKADGSSKKLTVN
ncbi:MAG TPA: Hsp20/alpha crystallin family protein [Burkholderiaceae bacterium]